MREEWTEIQSAPGYQASSLGRIRSQKDDKIIPQFVGHKDGYLCVRAGKRAYVHRLVCEAFYGSPQHGKIVAHWDGDPANNCSSNLRWATHRENEADKLRHGRRPMGSRIPWSKLTEQTASECLKLWSNGAKIRPLARQFGVSQYCIQCLIYGMTWRHVEPEIKRKFWKLSERAHYSV